jgi:hypothetical protein
MSIDGSVPVSGSGVEPGGLPDRDKIAALGNGCLRGRVFVEAQNRGGDRRVPGLEGFPNCR